MLTLPVGASGRGAWEHPASAAGGGVCHSGRGEGSRPQVVALPRRSFASLRVTHDGLRVTSKVGLRMTGKDGLRMTGKVGFRITSKVGFRITSKDGALTA